MTIEQIKNLYHFLYLFNGIVTGEDLSKHSEDYLLEKYTKTIGIQLDKTDLKKELNEIPTYLKYKSIWYHEEIPDRLMMFLCKIYDAHSMRLSVIYPIFAKYIGSPLHIHKQR